MKVIVNVAISLDGFMDDTSDRRLILSNTEDLARVDRLRASVDAILVGAQTIRSDNPSLRIKAAHHSCHPVRIVVSKNGVIPADARIFQSDNALPLIFVGQEAFADAQRRFQDLAEVAAIENISEMPSTVLKKLEKKGLKTVLIEGGSDILGAFFAADVVDEVHVAIAPFLLGEKGRARFPAIGAFPQNPARPLRLDCTERLGDMVVCTYVARVSSLR
jgi:5-amino-6-(5-phosphoribosylamino)uracil reductase